jgi:hypothetical protein
LAKKDVEKYKTVHFYNGTAVKASKINTGFEVETESGEKSMRKN